MGADKVVGISRKNDKRADVLRMGADEYIATSEEKGRSRVRLAIPFPIRSD